MLDRRQKVNLAAALACAGMLGYAIYAEKVLGLQPCPLCMFQRVCIGALGLVFLLAGLHRVRYYGAIVYGAFILVVAGAAIWVAGRHVWIQAQPPGTVPACGAPLDTLMQMFPLLEVVRKVMTGGGECGTIDWTFLGLSMPMWVLISASTLALIGLVNNAFLPVRSAGRR
jgi:disulfide bond formation protein DsbB